MAGREGEGVYVMSRGPPASQPASLEVTKPPCADDGNGWEKNNNSNNDVRKRKRESEA